MENQLYHHGIKGMKWGRRRYQNKDGSLTPAGKKRYDDSPDGATKPKSNHRAKLEEKYRQNGMNQKQAEEAAEKRIKTEKIIAATAGLTLAAATAYVVNKNIKERADGIIKAGTKMQVIGNNPNKSFDKAFYTAYKGADKTNYKGQYGKQLTTNMFGVKVPGAKAYKTTLTADKDVKIVSRKKAADVFADLYKNDSEFREAFKKSNDEFIKRGHNDRTKKLHKIASGNMTDKQLKRAGYDAFNIGLVNHDANGNLAAKKFYDKLKAQGYDAVLDINDTKYSGYNAKKPVIIFNKANKISVSDVKEMTDKQIQSNFNKVMYKTVSKELAKQGAAYAGIYLGSKALTDKVNEHNALTKYKSQHPGTELTDAEILEAINYKKK